MRFLYCLGVPRVFASVTVSVSLIGQEGNKAQALLAAINNGVSVQPLLLNSWGLPTSALLYRQHMQHLLALVECFNTHVNSLFFSSHASITAPVYGG